jgi:hypothetical protein
MFEFRGKLQAPMPLLGLALPLISGVRSHQMKDQLDFTKLPIGLRVVGQGTVLKCPKCGKNGICLKIGDVHYYTHYGSETFITASGEERSKPIRKRSKCRVVIKSSEKEEKR